MMQKVFFRATTRGRIASTRTFSLLTNYETKQPAKEGSLPDYQLDTKAANSKYYNPYTFDPQQLDY